MKDMGMGNTHHVGSGNLEWAPLPGDSGRWLKGALDVGRLSLSVKGTWREGSHGGTLVDKYKRLWKQASLHIGAPLEGLSTGEFERRIRGALRMKHLTLKRLRERDSREACFTGNPRRR
jgi:hypothetical protein